MRPSASPRALAAPERQDRWCIRMPCQPRMQTACLLECAVAVTAPASCTPVTLSVCSACVLYPQIEAAIGAADACAIAVRLITDAANGSVHLLSSQKPMRTLSSSILGAPPTFSMLSIIRPVSTGSLSHLPPLRLQNQSPAQYIASRYPHVLCASPV